MFGSVIGMRLVSKVISQSNNDEWSFYTQYTAIRPDWWATKWKKPRLLTKNPETQTTPKKPRSSGKNPAGATLAVWASAILCVVRRQLRTTGARVPNLPVRDYHGSASLLVWLWWLEQSSHDVDFQLLTFVLPSTQVVLSVVLHWLYIHYSTLFVVYLTS